MFLVLHSDKCFVRGQSTVEEFIIGEYDEKFYLSDSSSLDTILATDQRLHYKSKSIKKGNNAIRGFVRNYETLGNGNYKQVNLVYFEKKYFVQ